MFLNLVGLPIKPTTFRYQPLPDAKFFDADSLIKDH